MKLAPGKPSSGGVAGVELGCRKIERRGRVMDWKQKDGQLLYTLCPFRCSFRSSVIRDLLHWKLVLEVEVEVEAVEVGMVLVLEVEIALPVLVIFPTSSHTALTFSSLGPLYTAPITGGAFSAPH